MKGDFYKTAWGAKRAGIQATYVGTTTGGLRKGVKAASGIANATKSGLKFLFSKAPLIGAGATAFGTVATARAEGLDAAKEYFMMDFSGGSTVQDTVGAFTEDTIAPAMFGRTFDATSKFDDAIENGTLLLP